MTLMEAGADQNALETRTNGSPLLMAAAHGHAGVVKALLGKGACHTARNRYGQSSMHVAAGAGHADVLKELIVTPYTLNLEPQTQNSDLSTLTP